MIHILVITHLCIFQLYVNSMTLIFNTLLPLITLTTLNYLTYKALKRSVTLSKGAQQNQGINNRHDLLAQRNSDSQYVRRIVSFYKNSSRETEKNPQDPEKNPQDSEIRIQENPTNPKSHQEGLRSHGGENLIRKREARITKASIGITVMFVVCHTPRVIPNLFEVLVDPSTFPKVNISRSKH